MAALDSAHAALALGCDVVLCAAHVVAATRGRATAGSRTTHGPCSSCCSRPVTVAVPAGPRRRRAARPARAHASSSCDADLDGYAASGLPARTMGRALAEDPLFFAAALAAGTALAGRIQAP